MSGNPNARRLRGIKLAPVNGRRAVEAPLTSRIAIPPYLQENQNSPKFPYILAYVSLKKRFSA
jgi:hypothetical protein